MSPLVKSHPGAGRLHDPAPRRRRAGAGEESPRPAAPRPTPFRFTRMLGRRSTQGPRGRRAGRRRLRSDRGHGDARGSGREKTVRARAVRSASERCRERAEEGVVARVVDAAKRATSAASSSDCARGRTPSLRLKIRPARERRASRCTVTSVCKSGVSGDPRGSRARSRHSRARQGATRRERVLGGRASHLAVERLDRATPPLSSHPRDSRPASPLGCAARDSRLETRPRRAEAARSRAMVVADSPRGANACVVSRSRRVPGRGHGASSPASAPVRSALRRSRANGGAPARSSKFPSDRRKSPRRYRLSLRPRTSPHPPRFSPLPPHRPLLFEPAASGAVTRRCSTPRPSTRPGLGRFGRRAQDGRTRDDPPRR